MKDIRALQISHLTRLSPHFIIKSLFWDSTTCSVLWWYASVHLISSNSVSDGKIILWKIILLDLGFNFCMLREGENPMWCFVLSMLIFVLSAISPNSRCVLYCSVGPLQHRIMFWQEQTICCIRAKHNQMFLFLWSMVRYWYCIS